MGKLWRRRLDKKLIKFNIMKYLINPFAKFYDINGKASLKEFWFFLLFSFILNILVVAIVKIFNLSIIEYIINIIWCVVFATLGFRRLNDAGYNKWLFLLPFVNFILAGMPSASIKNN